MRRGALVGLLFALVAIPASASAQFDFRKNGHDNGPVTFGNGVACSSGPQCTSGNCINSVCCNSACGGACDACSIATGAVSDGTCANVAAASAGSPSCTPYLCSGASASCPATCSVNGDCIASHQCSAGVCVVDDFFTYLLGAPALGSQCTDALITSDQADAITCTRASAAFCTKADGTMVLHSNNRCRVEQYGVLMEASKTNYALRSMEIDHAAWGSFSSTTTANQGTFPDGNVTMEEVVNSANNGNKSQAGVDINDGFGPWTMSAYIAKPSGSGIATIGAQCNTGNAATCACLRADGTACTATILTGICYGTSTFTTTVQRMSVTLTCASSCTSLNAYLWPGEFLVSTGTSRYGGVQVETGAFATSYIPTVGTAVARLRDLLYTTLTQSIDAAGCFAATVRHGTVFNGINGWISTDQVGLYAQSATTLESVTSSGGAGITVPSLLSTTATARTYWNASVVGLESGGVSDTDVTGGTMSSDSIISFGDYLDGHVRGIRVNTNIGGCQ